MNEKILAQIIAELKAANAQALGLVAMAISKQLDAAQLKTDLQEIIGNTEQLKVFSPLATDAANQVLTAVQVEALLQASNQHAGRRPS